MPLKPTRIHFPEMALTLVRRASAQLPYNHYLFRTEPKWTKLEIKEYLGKVYGIRTARIATYIAPGENGGGLVEIAPSACRRVAARAKNVAAFERKPYAPLSPLRRIDRDRITAHNTRVRTRRTHIAQGK